MPSCDDIGITTFELRLMRRYFLFSGLLTFQIILGFVQALRARMYLSSDESTKRHLLNQMPSYDRNVVAPKNESIEEPLHLNMSNRSAGTDNNALNKEMERMLSLSRQYKPYALTSFRIHHVRMLMTKRSYVGFLYLVLALFMAVCAVLRNGLFVLSPGWDLEEASAALTCTIDLNLQPVLTLYLIVHRVIIIIIVATFALTVFIKLASLFGFLCCPMFKYKVQKCCLDHRYRKYRSSSDQYRKQYVKMHEESCEGETPLHNQ